MIVGFGLRGRRGQLDVGDGAGLGTVRGSDAYRRLVRAVADASDYRRFGAQVTHAPTLSCVVAMALAAPARRPEDLLEEVGAAAAAAAHYRSADEPALTASDGLVPRLASATGAPEDEVREAVADDVTEALRRLPVPDWRDAIPFGARVEVAYVPAPDGETPESFSVSHRAGGEPAGAWSVVPDAAFVAFLRLANVSSEEFLRALAKDPRLPSLTGSSLSHAWRGFRSYRDVDRPHVLLPEEVVNVLNSSPEGGTPMVVARVRVLDIVGRDPAAGTAIAEGGMVGLHHFPTGTGCLEPPHGRVTLPDSRWRVLGGPSVASLHDVSDDFFDVRLGRAEATTWRRVARDRWLREAAEGGFVEVVRDLDERRTEEFWVRTLGADESPEGPQATAEVWTDLAEAKRVGDGLAERGWEAAPSASLP